MNAQLKLNSLPAKFHSEFVGMLARIEKHAETRGWTRDEQESLIDLAGCTARLRFTNCDRNFHGARSFPMKQVFSAMHTGPLSPNQGGFRHTTIGTSGHVVATFNYDLHPGEAKADTRIELMTAGSAEDAAEEAKTRYYLDRLRYFVRSDDLPALLSAMNQVIGGLHHAGMPLQDEDAIQTLELLADTCSREAVKLKSRDLVARYPSLHSLSWGTSTEGNDAGESCETLTGLNCDLVLPDGTLLHLGTSGDTFVLDEHALTDNGLSLLLGREVTEATREQALQDVQDGLPCYGVMESLAWGVHRAFGRDEWLFDSDEVMR